MLTRQSSNLPYEKEGLTKLIKVVTVETVPPFYFLPLVVMRTVQYMLLVWDIPMVHHTKDSGGWCNGFPIIEKIDTMTNISLGLRQ